MSQPNDEQGPQASTSRVQEDRPTITDLKKFLVGELKETMDEVKKELKEDQRMAIKECMAEYYEKSNDGPDLSKGRVKYKQSLASECLGLVKKMGPHLLKQIAVTTTSEEKKANGFKTLKKHVYGMLQINQSGRLIDVLFNTVQFRESLAVLFRDTIDGMTDGITEPFQINVYRYMLQRLFTQQQLAYMCFGEKLKKYVKIFHAYLNAFE